MARQGTRTDWVPHSSRRGGHLSRGTAHHRLSSTDSDTRIYLPQGEADCRQSDWDIAGHYRCIPPKPL